MIKKIGDQIAPVVILGFLIGSLAGWHLGASNLPGWQPGEIFRPAAGIAVLVFFVLKYRTLHRTLKEAEDEIVETENQVESMS